MSNSDASLHILLVEDDPDQVLFLRTTLRIGSESAYALTHAGTLAEGMALLDELTPDIILLDLHLPDSEGLDTPRRMLERAGDVPVIIFSGNTDVTVSLEAVRLGAQDYLLKGEAREPLFSRAIMYAIERKRFTRQLQETHRQLEQRNAALEAARAELREERDMFVLGPTVLFRRGIEAGYPITYVSRNVSRFGYAPETLAAGGVSFDSLLPAEDREGFHRLLDTRLGQGAGHVEHEYRMRDARGEIVWLHEVVRLQRDAAGNPVAQLAYVVDVTHRVRAEAHLGSTRREYERMLGSSHEIVFEVDAEGCFVYVSPTIERLLGRSADDLIGRSFADIVTAPQREGWSSSLALMLAGGIDSVELPLCDAGGEERIFRIGVRRIFEDERVTGLEGLMTDIAERKEMEYDLRNIETVTQQYLDIAGVVFLSLDLEGRVSLVNKRGCELLGYREHEIVGRDWFDLCIPESIRDGMRTYFSRIVEGKEAQPETHENHVLTRSGDKRLLRWRNAMLHDARGAVIGVLSSGEDITERVRIEEEVRGTRELIDLALWGADLGAWEWEVATDTITLNHRARELLGFGADETLPAFARLREETLPADDVAATRALLDAHLAGKTVVYQAETWMIARGGEWKWVLERGKVVESDAGGLPLRVAGTWLDLTERKYAEIAIADSEKKFRQLAENSSDVIWTSKADLSLTFVSPSVEHLFGYSVEEAMAMQFTDLIAERAREAVAESVGDFLATVAARPHADRSFRDELPLLKKNGDILWAEVVATPVFDVDGRLVGVHGNTRDIHTRKLAQLALAESEEKYRLLVQNQTDLVVKVDTDGKFLFVSPSYCRMFGKTEEELLSQTFFPMVHEDDRLPTLEAMKKIFDPPYTSYVEQRAMTRDGWRWLGWLDTAVFDDRGEIVAIIGVGRDVTERRLAERAMVESEKRLRTVVSNLPVIMFTIDREGIFTLSEGMGLESLGLQPGEVVGQSVYDVYADYPQVTESVRRALSGDSLVAAIEMDGKSFETWYSPVIGEGGRIEQVIGVAADVTARKRTEEELDRYRNHLEELVEARTLDLERAGERLRRFRFALDSAADNIYIIDPQTMKYVDLNDSAVQALGYTREELLTMGPADIQASDQRELIMELYGQVRDGTLEIGMFETGHARKDGTEFPAEVFVRAFGDGEDRLLVATARDISRRRAAELALKDSESKYRNVLENANEAIIVLQDNLLRFFNYKVLELTGLKEQALKDLPIFEFVHPDDHGLIRRQYEDRLRGGLLPESYDVRMFDAAGTIKWMEVRDVLIDWEGKPATLNFFNDVTARKQAESYIRFQASLLSIVRNSVIATDVAGRVTYWNAFAETMYGFTAEEVKGMKLQDIATFRSDFERVLLPALRQRGHWEGEIERPRKDGTPLFVYSMWNAITEDNQPRGFVGIGMDLSERKKLERELLQSQKLASLGILSEGIAHELRNPLGYASSAAQFLLKKKDPTPEQLEKYSKVIHTGVERANKIVENLLLIGKPKGQLMKRQLDLRDSVKDAADLLSGHAGSEGVQLRIELGRDELLVEGNREMLVQLFFNLFTNAADAMSGSGMLTVTGNRKEGSIRIRVSDTGPGVPDDIIENIFDPFFTTNKTGKGVGLGLTLCYFIMEDHEGRIELDSATKTGAAFLLTFPSV